MEELKSEVSLNSSISLLQLNNNTAANSQVVEQLQLLEEWHRKMADYYSKLNTKYVSKGNSEAYAFQQFAKKAVGKKPTDVTFTPTGVKEIESQSKATAKNLESLKDTDLLSALEKHFVENQEAVKFSVEKFDANESNAINITNHIMRGNSIIDSKSAHILQEYTNLGLWLEKLNSIDQVQYLATIQTRCRFGESWAKQLRSFSLIWGKYKKLQSLALSISVAIKIAKNVNSALMTNPHEAERWN